MKPLFSFSFTFFFFFTSIVAISAAFNVRTTSEKKFLLGEDTTLGSFSTGFLQFAQAPSPSQSNDSKTVVLAKKRTERPDFLKGFKRYHDGWDITNRHYWSSVGFTGAAGFILAVLWLISFGIVLAAHHCCGKRIKIKDVGSTYSLRICLILLLVFTCASAIGCILLSVGQDEFHGEVLRTLKYVVNQSDFTVETLRNVTEYLSEAKNINVDQIFLPSNIRNDIDKLDTDLANEANILEEKTSENSSKIKKVFKSVRSVLIVVAAVMLLVALLGLLLSVLGHHHAINIFIFSGWLLVAATFVLCGGFVILNSAVTDTCVAMEEWVNNSQAETALSNILPCVDQRTTNQTLIKSKEVVNKVVEVINTAIYTYANIYPDPRSISYHNQSGPMIPALCSPFDSELNEKPCGSQEVSLTNASSVWQNYTCTVSSSDSCTSVGRITPDMYTQLVAAVNVSFGLYHYTPPLLGLQNCNFVRETFQTITTRYCPPLEHYLRMVAAGLGLISAGVLLCLILWVLYANRPQREEVFAKQSVPMKILDGNKNQSSGNTNVVSPSGGELV